MRIAILAHEKFPDDAKTAVGILRYGDHDVIGVVDRATAGDRVSTFLPDVQDASIYPSMEMVPDPVDALVIGISPIGGAFDESWRPDVTNALERGCDVISGLHYFLSEDTEFETLAAEHECQIWDVRKPPEDLTVAQGVEDVEAEVVLTVGTDCSLGKMTTTMELADAVRSEGYDVKVIPTGQTAIMIEGWGIPVDRVIGDFMAGAVESMVLEHGNDHDFLFVEGQGSIFHPAYSGVTAAILHGSMADSLVLCHLANRDRINEYEYVSIPSLPSCVRKYETLADPITDASVVAGSINTSAVESADEASAAIDSFESQTGLPAGDVIRFGSEPIVEAIL